MTVLKTGSLAVLMFMVTLGMAGCQSSIWPNDETPDVTKLPSTLGLTLLADKDINPNESQVASPVAFQLIWMSDDSKLMSADIDQLQEKKIEDTLGKNYINHQDFTLVPGQYKYLPPVEMDKDVKYIGVVVYYSHPNKSQWKKALKLFPLGRHYQVLVHLHKDSVDILKESED